MIRFLQFRNRQSKQTGIFGILKAGAGFWAFVFLVLTAVFVMKANPFQSETVAPTDILMRLDGWQSVAKELGYKNKVEHWERSDILDGMYPIRETLKKELQQGRFPKWNLNANHPIIHNWVSILFHPKLLLFLSIKNTPLGIYLGGLAHLILMGFGMFLFMRMFVSVPGALFGGLVYMLAGFNTAWFFAVTTGIWIPWAFWVTAKYLKTGDMRWCLGITISSLFLIYSRFFAVAGWTYYALSIMVFSWNIVFYTQKREFLVKLFLPYLFILLAFIIASPLFMPIFDHLSRTDLSYRYHPGPLPLKYLGLLVDPHFINKKGFSAELTVYTGLLSLIFSGISIFSAVKKEKYSRYILFFGFFLLSLTIAILFGAFKTEWVRMIPLFGFNMWSRLFSIIGFAIAILAAIGFDWFYQLLRRTFKIHMAVVVIVLLLFMRYQIIEQKKMFNDFNAVTKFSWYFPETESIRHVKQHIQPLQSVITDQSYLFPGTLGTYGITEWFRHGTFTVEEKKLISTLIKKPWSSPFTVRFPGSSIDFMSPLVSAFGTKYILMSKNHLNSLYNDAHFYATPIKASRSSKPLPGNRLIQYLEIENEFPIAISLKLANSNPSISTDLRVVVKNTQRNEIVEKIIINKEHLIDNSFARIDFTNPLPNGRYSIELEYVNETKHKLSVWTTRSKKTRSSYLEINGRKTKRSMIYLLHNTISNHSYKKFYKINKFEPKIVLLENLNAPDGAYFVSSLTDPPSKIVTQGVRGKALSDSDIIAESTLRKKGWLVIPMKFYHGWNVYIQDSKVPIEKYLGVFPAVEINDKTSSIRYRYEPRKTEIFRYISYVAISVFVIVSYLVLRIYKAKK